MAVSILYVEDYEVVTDAIKETLEAEGWSIRRCADGLSPLEEIRGPAAYHVLITDNGLPGMGGLELVRRARQLPHRKRVPVVLMSGDECEREAHEARADRFLKKPQGVAALVQTVTELLGQST